MKKGTIMIRFWWAKTLYCCVTVGFCNRKKERDQKCEQDNYCKLNSKDTLVRWFKKANVNFNKKAGLKHQNPSQLNVAWLSASNFTGLRCDYKKKYENFEKKVSKVTI